MHARIELLAQRLVQRVPREIEMEPMNQAAIAAILAPSKNLATLELLLIQRSLRPDDPW